MAEISWLNVHRSESCFVADAEDPEIRVIGFPLQRVGVELLVLRVIELQIGERRAGK